MSGSGGAAAGAGAGGLKRNDSTSSCTSPLSKRLRRGLTQESDIKVYERYIHETMQDFNRVREQRLKDYKKIFTLLDLEDHARDRRNKVFAFFSKSITKDNSFQTDEVYKVSQELLSVLDECREDLELVINWSDLCLPANEQSFAEAHRIKLQDFIDYLSSGLGGVVQSINSINSQLEKRAQTLQMLFSTKDVREEHLEGWLRVHRDLLVHSETNCYLVCAKTWEKVLEDTLLYANYWKMNLKDQEIAWNDTGKQSGGDYFG